MNSFSGYKSNCLEKNIQSVKIPNPKNTIHKVEKSSNKIDIMLLREYWTHTGRSTRYTSIMSELTPTQLNVLNVYSVLTHNESTTFIINIVK